MRRVDREMTADFAWEIFDEAPFATLGLTDGLEPYLLPVSPARIGEHIYIHCAPSGRKVDLITANPRAVLNSVSRVNPVPEDFSTEYASGMFFGALTLVSDETERIDAIRAISERYAASNMANFDAAVAASMHRTLIYRLDVETVTAKRKKYGPDGKELKFGRM
ncbi:MAG TPA: pyridoxamine 5'-phosphate oxidase family protein [Bellilinea sp.]|nr:pyridoxamine 5'-phosphate oxidase family protein [Bellilinea sp.]